MSILPLTPATIGIDLFSMEITMRDVVFATVDGEDGEIDVPGRTSIQGAVDARDRKVQFLFGKIVSDGDIAIFTYDNLYIADEYADGGNRNQTYITYQGRQYKVIAVKNWEGQAKARIYLATRHSQQQDL